jgi:signal recognition particle subunit SRP54
MFKGLTSSFNNVISKLKGKSVIRESDVEEAIQGIRHSLIEADVALPVIKDFVERLKTKAVGAEVIKSVSPADMLVKLVYDELVEMLGEEVEELNLATTPPAVVMMVGLQGSGKTTSSAKLALHLKKLGKKVLMASLDTYRPAAQEQLAILGKSTEVSTLPIVASEKPLEITKRALKTARAEGYDVLILDTAGRLHTDAQLMGELKEVKAEAKPIETLLVADALTGQDAVNISQEFHNALTLTGVVLTRVDSDSRGGASLSIKMVTGCSIKFMGMGEGVEAFEKFDPKRIASRILDQGDVVSLVERAAAAMEEDQAEKIARRMQMGKFDFNDLLTQMNMLKKLGGIQSVIGMLPGANKIMGKANKLAGFDERAFEQQKAIILSMTPRERRNPHLLNHSRKQRIAAGSGTHIREVNTMLKKFEDMQKMVKKISKIDKGMMQEMMNDLQAGSDGSKGEVDLSKFKFPR